MVTEREIYYSVKADILTSIADSIRAKTGETDKLALNDMASKIYEITGGSADTPLYDNEVEVV